MPSCNSTGISTCYGSWQQQHGEPALYCDFTATFSEGKVDTANNRSYVNYSVYAGYSDSSALFYGTTRSDVGTLRVYVNGSLVASHAVPIEYNYDDGHKGLVSFSGGCWVNHANDGTKTVSCQIKLDGGSDPRGVGFSWEDAYGNNASMTLTSIARGATISCSPELITVDGTKKITFTINNPIQSSMLLTIQVGSYTVTKNWNPGYSTATYEWTPSKDILKEIQAATGSSNLVAQATVKTFISPAYEPTNTIKFGISIAEEATSKIIKNGSKITFVINGLFFNYDDLFKGRTPLATKIAVMMHQNGTNNPLPYLEIDRVTVLNNTWNRMTTTDDVKVDTEEAAIYKNGSLEYGLGALGNDYETFTLKPGPNYIQCLYSSWAPLPPDFKLKYREVFL